MIEVNVSGDNSLNCCEDRIMEEFYIESCEQQPASTPSTTNNWDPNISDENRFDDFDPKESETMICLDSHPTENRHEHVNEKSNYLISMNSSNDANSPSISVLTKRNSLSTLSTLEGSPQESNDSSPILTERRHTYFDSWNDTNSKIHLFSLPVDSLHFIASFLTAKEWAEFGLTHSLAASICRDVFFRIRMHGFRCATEVVTAWKLGQQSDARELTALYIQEGVPIYPRSLGYSYNTLVWKMGVEAKEINDAHILSESQTQSNGDGNNNTARNIGSLNVQDNPRRPLDSFFTERYLNRPQDADFFPPQSTYVEEKCHFCLTKASEHDSRLGSRHTMTSRMRFAPSAPVMGSTLSAPRSFPARLPDFRPTELDVASTTPKVRVKVHRHLLHQHWVGNMMVDDDCGMMPACPISLAADFFHPNLQVKAVTGRLCERNLLSNFMSEGGQRVTDSYERNDAEMFNVFQNTYELAQRMDHDIELDSYENHPPRHQYNTDGDLSVPEASTFVDSHPGSQISLVDSDVAIHSENTPPSSGFRTPLQNHGLDLTVLPPLPPQISHSISSTDAMNSPTFCSRSDPPFFSQIDLENYDATSLAASSLSDVRDGIVEIKSHLKNRFTVYQRRLEALLSQNDSSGFEECLLDFWDEFLPTTANIHFHDRNTAVPRTSKLENFVTKPCPKAIGIVQCEIERIKIKSKKKGVNVAGRLFPTYEYRLFIRDRRSDSSSPESAMNQVNPEPRRDTIIMVAKNRGRKHQEARVILPAPGASKKGVNNYYLYLPQQVDVDTHYRVVNNDDEAELIPNGANLEIPTRTGDNNAPVLQGRLQSNFIGTEFQIFIPIIRKHPVSVRKPVTSRSAHVLSSDSESDYEVLSDTTSPTNRRNRFYRTKSNQDLLRRNNQDIFNIEANHPEPISEEESVDSGPTSVRRRHKRGYSLPNFPYRRSIRSSRRVVAHSIEPPTDPSQPLHPVFCEEEDGAITYSANLLGNRPRVMDVCVPRVSDDGTPGTEWKRHLGSIEDSADAVSNSMLSHFKQLQQRHENADHGQNDAHEDFGLLALQNRPPWWNDELQAFVLNFGGRVSVASVKNFQLCDRTDHDRIMLQFGRIQGRHSFTMDFQYPLTAVQAFAIAISSLQSKISFG